MLCVYYTPTVGDQPRGGTSLVGRASSVSGGLFRLNYRSYSGSESPDERKQHVWHRRPREDQIPKVETTTSCSGPWSKFASRSGTVHGVWFASRIYRTRFPRKNPSSGGKPQQPAVRFLRPRST